MEIFELFADLHESIVFPKEQWRSSLTVSAAGGEALFSTNSSWVTTRLAVFAPGPDGVSVHWWLPALWPFLQENSSKVEILSNEIRIARLAQGKGGWNTIS